MALIPSAGPLRVYALMTLVDSVGFGLYGTGSVLFFTRILGFSPSFVGLGLTVAAVVGLLAGLPGGRLSDRIGPKRALVPLYVAQAALFVVFPFVSSHWAFLVVVCGIALTEGAARPARRAAISLFATGEERVRVSAYNRAVLNVGFSVGVLGAGAALAIGSELAYAVLVWGNAASFLVAAFLFSRIPMPPADKTAHQRQALMFTPRIVAAALCCGVLYASASLLEVGLPLQVSENTSAPRWIIAVLLLINTGLAIAFQVRASRGSETVIGAARANRRAGFALVAGCLFFAASAFFGIVPAIIVLIAAVVALTAAELLSSAGQWGMSYALAPDGRQAEFLGAFTLMSSAAGVAGPYLATQVVTHGVMGWAIAAAVFVTAGLLAPVIARRQEVPSVVSPERSA